MVSSPALSAGTRPLGLCLRISALKPGRNSGTTRSSKAAPLRFNSSQPRSDQDE